MYYCIYKHSPFNYWIVELLYFIYRIMKYIYSIWKSGWIGIFSKIKDKWFISKKARFLYLFSVQQPKQGKTKNVLFSASSQSFSYAKTQSVYPDLHLWVLIQQILNTLTRTEMGVTVLWRGGTPAAVSPQILRGGVGARPTSDLCTPATSHGTGAVRTPGRPVTIN